MHGFGSHTFSLINSKGERVWVKFHFITQQGIKNLSNDEAADIIAKDRESHGRDLFDAIERGDYPRWKLCVQIMTEEQARSYKENPFDLTKVWSHKQFPLIEVGILELNKNPENYFAQIEQAAFNPAHIVPGIGLSPDKMLQGRLFSYGDAQRYRLGVNHDQIPVNRPRCPFHSYHRDGLMRVDENSGATKGYSPNSIGEWQVKDTVHSYSPVNGEAMRYNPYEERDDNCFYQAGDLYRLMTEEKRRLLISNTAADIMPVTDNIKYRHAAHCYLADVEYGTRIADALHLSIDEVKRLASLSEKERLEATKTVC
jgi:catalase